MNKLFVRVNILIFLAIALKDAAGHSVRSCPPGFYRNTAAGPESPWQKKCILCTTCLSGQGVKRRCTAEADTVCEPCVPGKSHVAGWGNRKYCRTCKKCGKSRETLQKCTLHEDTQCGECKKGFYWNPILDACEPCSWCFPKLYEPSERFVARQCMIPEIPADYQCAVLTIEQHQPTWQSTFSEQKAVEEDTESSGGSGDDEEQGSGNYETEFVSDDEDFLPAKTNKPQLPTSVVLTSDLPSSEQTTTLDHTQSDAGTDVTMTQERRGGSESTRTNHETNNRPYKRQDAVQIDELASTDKTQSSDNVLIIALATAGAVCLLLVAALVLVSRKYMQLKRTYVKGSVTNLSDGTMDETLLNDVRVED